MPVRLPEKTGYSIYLLSPSAGDPLPVARSRPAPVNVTEPAGYKRAYRARKMQNMP